MSKTIYEMAYNYSGLIAVFHKKSEDDRRLLLEAFEAGAKEALANQWRNVKVELPANNTIVFVLRGIGSIPETSFYRGNGIFTYDINLINAPEVTHWMYIPQMPKY